jgi:hypothetical protein
MRRSSICLSAALFLAAGGAEAAGRAPPSVIAEPQDLRPGAIARPATEADRAWRRTRRSPEIVTTQQTAPSTRRLDAPRYDGRGRRLNVPGRPDTYDQIGRARALDRPAAAAPRRGPTMRTDAATRIDQLAPRR